jgi:hypothetical protein
MIYCYKLAVATICTRINQRGCKYVIEVDSAMVR